MNRKDATVIRATARHFSVEESWSLIGGYHPVFHLWCDDGPRCTYLDRATAEGIGQAWVDTGVWPTYQGFDHGFSVKAAA